MPMRTALEKAFGEETAASLEEDIASVASGAAEALERKIGREFVEMSLDVGLDGSGHPWIFEINAKPLHFDEKDIQRRRNVQLLAYAKASVTADTA